MGLFVPYDSLWSIRFILFHAMGEWCPWDEPICNVDIVNLIAGEGGVWVIIGYVYYQVIGLSGYCVLWFPTLLFVRCKVCGVC